LTDSEVYVAGWDQGDKFKISSSVTEGGRLGLFYLEEGFAELWELRFGQKFLDVNGGRNGQTLVQVA